MDLPTPTIHISRNKELSLESEEKERTILFVGRSEIQIGNFSSDLLELRELKTFVFPYAVAPTTWADAIQPIINQCRNRDTLCLIEPNNFLLVPDSLYREQDAEKYFNLSGVDIDSTSILTYRSSRSNMVLLSTIPSLIKDELKDLNLFSDIQLYIDKPERSTKNQLHLIIRDEHIDVVVRNPDLQLANRYNADHANDILYFCVTCCEQCGMKVDNCQVIISGIDKKLNPTKELLSRYFSNVIASAIPSKLKTPYGIKDIDPAAYFSILNAYQCG